MAGSYEIEARGEVKFNRDVTDIESISRGGSFTLEQHLGDDTKRLVVRPLDDGTLERSYSENGARREFDAAARSWLAEALVALDRQTAFAADQRVPALLERGGVDAVLKEITLVSTDYARRRYYTKLLSMRQLDRAQVKRVVEQAGADMTSDYELAELLVALSKLDAFGDDSHTAFVAAAKKIGSDYERRRALNALLQRDRLAPATVQALLDAASTIQSDYELAELLIDKPEALRDQRSDSPDLHQGARVSQIGLRTSPRAVGDRCRWRSFTRGESNAARGYGTDQLRLRARGVPHSDGQERRTRRHDATHTSPLRTRSTRTMSTVAPSCRS